MKKQIPLQSPPDFSSMVPPDLAGGGPPPPASTSGMDVDNLSPEEASAIPDQGTASIGFKVHHRRSEVKIHPKTGEKTEHHSVHMHVHHIEPHPEEKPAKKKLTDSTDAQEAFANSPEGTP